LFICFHVCALACVLVHRKTKISLSMINKKAKQLGCSFFFILDTQSLLISDDNRFK